MLSLQRIFTTASFGALITMAAAPAALAGPLEDISGVWLTEAKTAHVEIADCGDGTPCGTLVWVDSAQDADTPLDINNTDPALTSRPLIGIQMIYGFKAKKSQFKGGKIYNPGDGKTYGSSVKRIDANTLQVKGCIGPLCQKQIWTRVTPQG